MSNLNNFTTLLNLIGLSSIQEEYAQKLTDIVITTSLEQPVHTILYTSCENFEPLDIDSAFVLHRLASGLALPLMHFDTSPHIEKYVESFNAELLSIAKLSQEFSTDEHLLTTLWQRLWHNAQSRLIILLDETASTAYVAEILRFCVEHKAINVIALQPRMTVTARTYWTVSIFPHLEIVKRKLPIFGRGAVFPSHLRNMYGHPLRVLAKAWSPQLYTYTPSSGNATSSGFWGRAVMEYARRYNATIEYPYSMHHKTLSLSEHISSLENHTIDLGALTLMLYNNGNISFSVIFHLSSWCLMVPVEKTLPRSTFYYNIVHPSAFFLFSLSVVVILICWAFVHRRRAHRQLPARKDFVNLSLLTGLLGMPFWTERHLIGIQKVIHITISVAGIIFGTAYGAYLQSFIVNAPAAATLLTIEDLLNSGIRVAIKSDELHWIRTYSDMGRYIENFTIFTNHTKYLKLRDDHDTRYAYSVGEMWDVYNEQQEYFSRPLFRFSDICFNKNYPMVLPLLHNSIYRRHLYYFLLRLDQSGLISFWRRNCFWEYLDMGWILLEDRNKQPGIVPLKIADLYYVLMAMSAFLILSIICFGIEIFLKNFQSWE
ncbi:uncharacterized protein LOC128919969 [Zeugodacus cucurbitae]|uniref:uncharacterized protein LOC128919969 n=1 Tax=Zeugodacus cucurbitae TaxID=28588 RepID=UPI0023D92DE3|nr:uncharacterized protein LOC128919969 [Zeugodacus cucurbitae]